MDFSYLCKVNTRERFYSLWCEAFLFLVGSHLMVRPGLCLDIGKAKSTKQSHHPNPAIAKIYKTMQENMPPPQVQRNLVFLGGTSLNRLNLMFIPKIPATRIKKFTTTVAIDNRTPICRRWFCLSASIMLR